MQHLTLIGCDKLGVQRLCVFARGEEELEKATKPTEVTPGVHSKVSQKKYKNVDGKLSTNDQQIPEEYTHTPAKSKKEKAKQRKLSMELLV